MNPPPLPPGGTIGILGGGQLGRMTAIAAARIGYRTGVFCHRESEPAAQVATWTCCAPLDDADAIDAFAHRCDRITLEFENLPTAAVRRCAAIRPAAPSAHVLGVAQDRWIEKTTLSAAGLPVAPFAAVPSTTSLPRVAERLGLPMIVKTARQGYDGKGQTRIDNVDELARLSVADSPPEAPAHVAEAFVAFETEISVVVGRDGSGDIQCFAPSENLHANHILDVSIVPAAVSSRAIDAATELARHVAGLLDLVGVLCVEFFVRGDEVLINEIAPRPHNSGHLTIEGCRTSQFEQLVRAVAGLPLGDVSMVAPAAAMKKYPWRRLARSGTTQLGRGASRARRGAAPVRQAGAANRPQDGAPHRDRRGSPGGRRPSRRSSPRSHHVIKIIHHGFNPRITYSADRLAAGSSSEPRDAGRLCDRSHRLPAWIQDDNRSLRWQDSLWVAAHRRTLKRAVR